MAGKEDLPGSLAPLMAKFIALEEKYSGLEERFNKLQEESSISKSLALGTLKIVASDGNGLPPVLIDLSHPPSRAKVVISRIDMETGEHKDQPANEPILSAPSDTVEKSQAFILRKIIADPDQNEGNYSQVEMISDGLWNLLKQILNHWLDHIFDGSPVLLYSPYEPLVLYWDDLNNAAEKEVEDAVEKQARADLKLLLETIGSGSGDAKLDKYLKSRKSNMDQRTVTYETLWTIFAPGTLVYGRFFQGEDQVFLVYESEWLWSLNPRPRYWELTVWSYDWNGRIFKRSPAIIKIEAFEGQKAISSLSVFPLKFHDDVESVKRRLIERGRKFRGYCMSNNADRMFDYGGPAIFEQRGFSNAQDDDDRIEGRVMIDFESYFRYGPAFARIGALIPQPNVDECGCHACRKNLPLREKLRTRFDEEAHQKGEWHDEQYMLCPPRVLGYILYNKQWAQLQVTCLKNIPRDDYRNSWSERLVLKDGDLTKNIILNLVTSHGTKSEEGEEQELEVDDIVANKGKGLVILLYGPPGVGKTTTAETVAIAARKPLFSISVADVGDKAKKVEKKLAKIFSLASSWQAILLIDEADVFLESRGQGAASNVEKNSLVSVFLRILEYYQGILMLTTNQIAQFDVAIKSRIHVAFKYEELTPDQTLAIFNGFLQPLDKKGLIDDMRFITEWLTDDVVKMRLDGRQIRNIVTSAVGIARAEAGGKGPKLTYKHLKAMVSNVKDFKDEFIAAYERYKTIQSGGRAQN
ncbi:uncharacterized protein EAE98_002614 [Botrytis deweyae]|uniref:AAA+ ATPase domain-containing protein n=1 Tax=Botrytis deweyae TaxID=2478750 RepID=A0ABQ7IXM5_9HELO|nr:uncharacterized protein EAE98_002614 [Botrytis deweyae]KAF7936395.1 hypothetical protein EAE98_002614 [Botrytis deweyae]